MQDDAFPSDRPSQFGTPFAPWKSTFFTASARVFPGLVLFISAFALTIPTTQAQRFIPATDWSAPTSGALASGSRNGGTVNATGSLDAGGVSDQGFFLRRPAGEGDDLRVAIGAPSTTGVAGAMVRDSDDPAAPFVFAGIEASGTIVVLYRHRVGDPVKRIPYGAAGVNKWFRLIVGRDTVYAYNSSAATDGTAGAWYSLGAFTLDLPRSDYRQRRGDLGGLFVSQGSATFTDLYSSEKLFWSEPTTTTTAPGVVQSPAASWASVAATPGTGALSPHVLRRSGTRSAATVDFPLTTPTAGEYDVYIHCLSGNGTPLRAALVVGGVQQTPLDLPNVPAGHSSWLLLRSSFVTTAGAGQTFQVRLFDNGTSPEILADAVRAVLVNGRDSATLKYPGWQRTPQNLVEWSGNGGSANWLQRNANGDITGWNAGGYGIYPITGDFRMGLRLSGSYGGKSARVQAGVTASVSGNNPASIPWRFYQRNDNKVQFIGGHSGEVTGAADGATTLEIERIGTQMIFRRGGVLRVWSTLPAVGPLQPDVTFFDPNGKVTGTWVQGHWVHPSSTGDLDGDGTPDTTERQVIDFDSEDTLQSIFDLRMTDDPDQDGLSHEEELSHGTHPAKADSDGDGLDDRVELWEYGTDPWRTDTDGDELSDFYEVHSSYGFSATSRFTLGDGVSDTTRWEILEADPNDAFSQLTDVRTEADFDLDGVSNLHESQDATSAVNASDYFLPVAFDRYGGSLEGAAWTLETTPEGVASSRLVRTAPAGTAGGTPAGGISHHEALDGTRVRFQFLPLSGTFTGGEQLALGFTHRGLDADEAGDLANYAVAIRRNGAGEARVSFYGAPAPNTPVLAVSPADVLELRLELAGTTRRLHLDRYTLPAMTKTTLATIDLPVGFGSFDLETNPLALAVSLHAEGSGVHNLRYRRVFDPDSDDDLLPDRWEQRIVAAFPTRFATVGQVEPGADADGDTLSNQREYELGTDPTKTDTDGDQMPDGWEVTHGLDPMDPADGSEGLGADGKPVADQDGDGLSNLEEFRFGSRPDLASTMEDGFSDFWKHRWGLDPMVFLDPDGDLDSDGLSNNGEVQNDTNPDSGDTDNDGVGDGDEVAQGTDPGEPPIPMPSVVLQGRTHRTEGGGGMVAGFYGGSPDEVIIETRYRSYLLNLVRDLYDFNNIKTGEEPLEFIASAEEFQAELEQKFNEGWRKANEDDQPQGLQPYEYVQIIPGSPPTWRDAWAESLLAYGPMLAGFARGEVGMVASEGELRPFYENPDPSAYWGGSVTQAKMGFPGAWSPSHRLAYGRSPQIGAAVLENHAKFLTGLVPEVQWSEYWLQADGPVPRRKEAKYTLALLAIERNPDGEMTLLESGAVTFTIPGAKELSTVKPEVEGFAAAASWVEARNDGTLMVVPPVERGVERSLLPVEVLQPVLDANLQAVKDGSGADELVDTGRVRFCRWRDAFPADSWQTGSHEFDEDFIKKDRDRAVIRIPGDAFEEEKNRLSVFLRTEDAGGTVLDPETEIEFERTAEGDFESTVAVMASEFDDQYDPARYHTVSDEEKNDPTHYGKLGGKLVLRIPDLDDAEIEKPLMEPKATVDVKVYLLANTQGNLANMNRIVREDFKTTEQIFAQIGIGIKIHAEFFDGLMKPENAELAARLYNGDKIRFGYQNQDLNDILSVTNSPRKPTMPTVFYVDGSLENLSGPNEIRGTALSRDHILAHGYAAVSAFNSTPITLAHEIGHLLGLALGPVHEWVGMLPHYHGGATHLLMCEFPEFQFSPVNTSYRLEIRDERWLFEFTPERSAYETAKGFIHLN